MTDKEKGVVLYTLFFMCRPVSIFLIDYIEKIFSC